MLVKVGFHLIGYRLATIASRSGVVWIGQGCGNVFDRNAVGTSSSAGPCSIYTKLPEGFSVLTQANDGSNQDSSFGFQVAGTSRNGTLGGGADAWVSFDGTDITTVGSEDRCTIFASFNVDRVVRQDTGVYIAGSEPRNDGGAIGW